MQQVCDRSVFGIDNGTLNANARLRLEGSVRVERDHVRVSVRLVNNLDRQTAWTAQFDSNGVLGIALQEELANAFCDSLSDYFRLRTNTV